MLSETKHLYDYVRDAYHFVAHVAAKNKGAAQNDTQLNLC